MVMQLSHAAGVRFAEVGYLLIVIAGVWFVASELPPARWTRFRAIVAGTLLAAAGVLLIVATHWGAVN